MRELKRRSFKLPLGLYRTDSLIGAVLNFNLDPAKYRWDSSRILVHPGATWDIPTSKWWRFKDVRTHSRRIVRQAQGVLENAAVRDHLAIRKIVPEDLPSNVEDLVLNWISNNPQQARRLFQRQPLTFYAARKLRKRKDWSDAGLSPNLLYEMSSAKYALSN